MAGILGLLPFLGPMIRFVIGLCAMFSGVIAVRESAEIDTMNAVITAVIAGVIEFSILFCAAAPFAALWAIFSGG